MMDKDQLRDLITRVLKDADLYSVEATELLMMTAAVESNLGQYIKQVRGPALGIFQMEPATHDDIWENYIKYKGTPVVDKTSKYWSPGFLNKESELLEYNLGYMIIMARIHYLRVKEKLPSATDVDAMAAYWKEYYNTVKGKGSITKAVDAYEKYCV